MVFLLFIFSQVQPFKIYPRKKSAMTGSYRFAPALLILLALTVAGCASTGSDNRSRRNENEISQEEVQGARSADNAYSLVQRLRPNWLRKRGRSSVTNPTDIKVYIEGARYASPRALRQVQVMSIASMEYLSPAQATNRLGGGHENGAILVFLKSR